MEAGSLLTGEGCSGAGPAGKMGLGFAEEGGRHAAGVFGCSLLQDEQEG